MQANVGSAATGACSRVVFLIEANNTMVAAWPEYRAYYIEPLLRAVDAGSLGIVEMAIVLLRSKDAFHEGAPVESSGWLHDTGAVSVIESACQCCGSLSCCAPV